MSERNKNVAQSRDMSATTPDDLIDTVECPDCNGDGATCEDCKVCHGNGEMNCKQCDGESTVECGDCGGEDRYCEYCNGYGVSDCDDCWTGQVTCEDCHGDGNKCKECETCDTTGEVPG